MLPSPVLHTRQALSDTQQHHSQRAFGKYSPNNPFPLPLNPSTSHPVTFHVANSTVIDSDAYHHHDTHWQMELASLCKDIVQTFATFSTFLKALTSSPAQTTSVLTTTMPTTSASVIANYAMDVDDNHHHDHQHMVDLPSPRCELCQIKALPVAKIKQTPLLNILPQLTTMTPDMNNNDDCHNDQQ